MNTNHSIILFYCLFLDSIVPYKVDVFEKDLYVTTTNHSIYVMNKFGRDASKVMTLLVSSRGKISDIIIVQQNKQKDFANGVYRLRCSCGFFKGISWLTILYAHISATIQQIITNFSAVVTYQMKAKLKIAALLHLGNYVSQVHHTTNTGESREAKIKKLFCLIYLCIMLVTCYFV